MTEPARPAFRCVLHGSFRKHFAEIQRVHRLFTEAGIEVLAPTVSEIAGFKDGFALLSTDEEADPRMVELLYLHHLKRLGENGFSYFVDPEGYVGKSASYELGIAQVSNTRCFFSEPIADHPAYLHKGSVWKAERLAEFIVERGELPAPVVEQDEAAIHALWEDLMVPGSVVAVGGIIEYDGPDAKKEKDVLLVRTHKWGGRYSIIGGKVRRNERLEDALKREIMEESGLASRIGEHLCTFDQIKNSGYHKAGIQHVFVDKVVQVGSRNVRLNDEAQEHVWMPAKQALRDLPIEPNARHTLELYAKMFAAA
ncbi:MAG TPA: NUDIX domain-containing protein [Candidatus Binatia bacterium]|jgi:ADP-ribose pyrophosphatase YjhB (NUDIX family)|nr:NUDIX domain-containing protein [Candidatus Binatia bacterium]